MPMQDVDTARVRDRPAYQDDAARWDAFAARDRAADGVFVAAVRTTGIYCRPTCPAKTAKRLNVAFYATCEAAEAAGYRPCKRCRPNEASPDAVQAAAVERACRLIESSDTAPSLGRLSLTAGMSPYHFHRVFKRLTGVTPKVYAQAQRAGRVAASLRRSGTVTEAVYEAGYNASSRFYADAKARLGMTPTAYRKGGAGMTIRFAVAECSLGSVLVAATEKGVCSIMLSDDPEALVQDLQRRFPNAAFAGADEAFEALVGRAIALVEAPRGRAQLPLDIHGTAFQQRVWDALRTIPAGSTASYADIARAIGEPAAVRAVAQACGANHIAVAIPCHRVVRSDGALSGYRWGIERKRTLLDREGARRDPIR